MQGNLYKRLARLEAPRRQPFADVLELIAEHRYYDTLSDAQKDRYFEYIGESRVEAEAEALAVLGDIHFMIMK